MDVPAVLDAQGSPPQSFYGLTRTLATLFADDASPVMAGDPVVAVRDIRFSRGGRDILAGVSFDVRDRIVAGTRTGQIVCILGPSGIGKTTLLRLIAGLETPDQGEILASDGVPLDPQSVGVVFQSAPLLRHRTVLGNLLVAGGAGGLGREAAMARAHALLDRFRLSPRAQAYPAELSGGERQRAAVAQQTMVPRRVLLMDEPFSGLDPRSAHEVQKLVFEVADADDLNSVVIVTHDVRAAVTTADQLIVLGRSVGGEGALVRASWDLVEHGVCALPERTCGHNTAPLENELRELFLSL